MVRRHWLAVIHAGESTRSIAGCPASPTRSCGRIPSSTPFAPGSQCCAARRATPSSTCAPQRTPSRPAPRRSTPRTSRWSRCSSPASEATWPDSRATPHEPRHAPATLSRSCPMTSPRSPPRSSAATRPSSWRMPACSRATRSGRAPPSAKRGRCSSGREPGRRVAGDSPALAPRAGGRPAGVRARARRNGDRRSRGGGPGRPAGQRDPPRRARRGPASSG